MHNTAAVYREGNRRSGLGRGHSVPEWSLTTPITLTWGVCRPEWRPLAAHPPRELRRWQQGLGV